MDTDTGLSFTAMPLEGLVAVDSICDRQTNESEAIAIAIARLHPAFI